MQLTINIWGKRGNGRKEILEEKVAPTEVGIMLSEYRMVFDSDWAIWAEAAAPSAGDVIEVQGVPVHITRVVASGVYGHTTSHCDAGGCSGDERFFG